MDHLTNLGNPTVSVWEHFILPTKVSEIIRLPKENSVLSSETFFHLFTNEEFQKFDLDGLLRFRKLVPNYPSGSTQPPETLQIVLRSDANRAAPAATAQHQGSEKEYESEKDFESGDLDSEHPPDKRVITLMTATPGMALSQTNLIKQIGFDHSTVWYLIAWRPQKGRLVQLLNERKIEIVNRGMVRGLSILTDDFTVTQSEAENSAVLKIDLDLTNYHHSNYMSDRAFRAGNVCTFGHQLSPLFRPSTKIDRWFSIEHFLFQGLSVLSDLFVFEFGFDLNSDDIRAESYYRRESRAEDHFHHSEKDHPTTVSPWL